jgi:hypothetical protein
MDRPKHGDGMKCPACKTPIFTDAMPVGILYEVSSCLEHTPKKCRKKREAREASTSQDPSNKK